MTNMTAACTGQSALFDSLDPRDHAVARTICAGCPTLTACRTELARVKAAHAGAGPSGGPRGTWAGVLVAPPAEVRKARQASEKRRLAARRLEALTNQERAYVNRRQERAEQDAAFDMDTLMAAEVAYSTGERSVWATTGHRIYERGRARARRARGAA